MSESGNASKETSDQVKPAAFTFPYTLDPFQQQSIDHLERGDSVLVSAHTSAGKTTVATYAIAMHLREKRRVIYTSPIKALSNQKFREFCDTFGEGANAEGEGTSSNDSNKKVTASVGLMTGDTTIRSSADCLVMTTEILRSMLYRGTEMLREVGCVIFDEVHYMRDRHRGVVWEETIILLPRKCQYVFLSATIPNGQQFVDWVMHIHPGLKCHVVHTDHRPTPLRHYVCPTGGTGLFPVVDEKGVFQEESYKKALTVLGSVEDENKANKTKAANDTSFFDSGYQNVTQAAKRARGGGRSQHTPAQQVMQILSHVILNNMHPCIVFVFAKAECETLALNLAKQTFNTEEEEKFVTHTYKNAIEALCEDDQQLPAVQALLPLLQRGIGIHHSGLLPILKEVVELLFQAGLVKVLFSTETFSLGLNMPARTVVFNNIRKWDGTQKRLLTSGEYIQMSGRAGRRGLDKNGVVIVLLDEAIEAQEFKAVSCGKADPLISSFHLTYNMILNLLRIEDADPKIMMRRSFYQYQQEFGRRPVLEKLIQDNQEQKEKLRTSISPDLFKACQQYSTGRKVFQKLQNEELAEVFVKHPKNVLPFLQVGRIIQFVHRKEATKGEERAAEDSSRQCGIIITGPNHEDIDDGEVETEDAEKIFVEVIVESQKGFIELGVNEENEESAVRTHRLCAADIVLVSKLRIKSPSGSFQSALFGKLRKKLDDLLEKHKDDLMPLDAIKDMKIESQKLTEGRKKIAKLQEQISKSPLVKAEPDSPLALSLKSFQEIMTIDQSIAALSAQLEKFKGTIVLEDELDKMMRVLRRMEYIDDKNIILRKGKIACEITTTDQDELLLVELLFRGVFNDMEVELIVALLSCLVNVHKTPDQFDPGEKYHAALRKLYDISGWISKVSTEVGLIGQDDFSLPTMAPAAASAANSEKVMPSLIDVTYRWAKGAKFTEVIQQTDAFEGDVVRMMRRLEELLRQMATAAKSSAVGSQLIYEKMMAGIQSIKRDIVFASSLYV